MERTKRKSKKVTLSDRDLAWRLKRHEALSKIKSRIVVSNKDALTIQQIEDFDNVKREIDALSVVQSNNKITTIPFGYTREVINMAIKGVFYGIYPSEMSLRERQLKISRWLRERGIPVPSTASFCRFFKKNK